MDKLRSYPLVVLGLAALAIALAATSLAPNVAQAAAPNTGPVPFQQTFTCSIPHTGYESVCQSAAYSVPAGKRLVVEYVSGRASIYQQNMVASLQLGVISHTLTLGNPQQWNQWNNSRTVSQQMLGFAEAGAFVRVELEASNIPITYDAVIDCVVTGYLVPV